MKKGWPDREQAEKIWQQGIDYAIEHHTMSPQIVKEYIFHTQGIARSAALIAARLPDMDTEKAYVLGLLHDYGKRKNEKAREDFHVRDGYESLMAMGYPEAARICLTHSFPKTNFDYADYAYPLEWLDWTSEKLADLTYDDYDRLIQFCDMLFEGLNIVTIEERILNISRRYGLELSQLSALKNNALTLKAYFDKQCNTDVYALLGLVK